jgi:predicted component of type VI protein secretion system
VHLPGRPSDHPSPVSGQAGHRTPQEADIVLEDPSISRRHCVIEARKGVYYARNISASNPLAVNGQPATEKRLCSGDQLKIGAWSLAFISSRRDDTRTQDQPRHGHSTPWGWVVGLLFVVAAGYAGYERVLP